MQPSSFQPSERRVALVTGANRGIGFEIARQLAGRGITVIVGTRDEQKGVRAQKQLTEEGLDVHFTSIDVADTTSIMATGRTQRTEQSLCYLAGI